ncbi:hypothetical protein L7F22_062261 [Adiantum nelumboides]|nr:hypothetical protein [Adiantum nelumboides]
MQEGRGRGGGVWSVKTRERGLWELPSGSGGLREAAAEGARVPVGERASTFAAVFASRARSRGERGGKGGFQEDTGPFTPAFHKASKAKQRLAKPKDCWQSHLLDYHVARFELYSGTLESLYAASTKAALGCNAPYITLCEGYIGPCTILCCRCPNGVVDADWAGSATDRWSTSRFMFTLKSVAITGSSKKQPTVTLSSIEVDYRGATVAACEVAWLRKLLMDLRLQVDIEVVIYCDNLSSIQLAKNPIFHARTKHIEVHCHFVRDQVLAGDIDLVYVSIEEQVADIFTKALGAEKLRCFWTMLGVL